MKNVPALAKYAAYASPTSEALRPRRMRMLARGAVVALIALSLTFASFSPVDAGPARRDDMAALLAAMAAMAIIASTVNNDRAAASSRAEPPRHRHPHRARKVLPRKCLEVVPGRHGGTRLLYRARCVERRVELPLPRACRTRERLHGRWLPVYRSRCLARHGWLI